MGYSRCRCLFFTPLAHSSYTGLFLISSIIRSIHDVTIILASALRVYAHRITPESNTRFGSTMSSQGKVQVLVFFSLANLFLHHQAPTLKDMVHNLMEEGWNG